MLLLLKILFIISCILYFCLFIWTLLGIIYKVIDRDRLRLFLLLSFAFILMCYILLTDVFKII